MKALIFGSNGQDGQFLFQLLKKNNIEVIGIARSNSIVKGDVSDYEFVKSVILTHKPTYIFHLAANSTASHNALFDNHSAICSGTINILEAVRLNSPFSKVFLSGSALQFKNEGQPIDEQTSFEAKSPYAFSRIHSVYAARYYRSSFDLKVYVGYFFNHDSQLRSEKHINQKIAATALRISKGSREKLEIGNIDVLKEFNYAGDIVEAIWKLVNQNKVFEAIIGSGEVHSIKEWVEYCFKKVNIDWRNHLITKKNFSPEYKILVSNPSLLKQTTGWEPVVDFYKLADKMMRKL